MDDLMFYENSNCFPLFCVQPAENIFGENLQRDVKLVIS